MTTRIRWTEAEINQLADLAASIRIDRMKSEIDAIREAQLALPAERRRKILGLTNLNDDLVTKFRQRVKEIREVEEEVKQVELSPPPQQQERSIDQLISEIASRVAEAIVNAVRDKMSTAFDEVAASGAMGLTAAQQRKAEEAKQKLLIVGLLPAQAEIIKQKFARKYDLKFVSSQESAQMVSSRAGDVSKIVLMTSFISHSHQQSAVANKGRDGVALVEGGVANLTKYLIKQ